MTTFAKLRQVAIAQKIDEAARAEEKYEVFLAGPFVLVDEPLSHEVNSANSATILRYRLYHFLTEKGHNIYLGEDTALRDTGEAHFSEKNNAVLYERHYIKRYANAVIIFPSSPGSFCEIGDWVSDKQICSFMLVVIDEKYEEVRNYINDGIVKFARMQHAEVRYLDYKDVSRIEEVCDTFLKSVAAGVRIEKLYDRA